MTHLDDGYFRAFVRTAERLTPNMVRVVLHGPELAHFVSSGRADERVGITFPEPGSDDVPLPTFADGRWDHHDTTPAIRVYSVRHWDAGKGELTVDFVVHDGGVAAQWAQSARPGDPVLLQGPDGWYAPPPDTAWQLLIADMTGLPALGRIVEELSPDVRVRTIVEVIDEADRQPLPGGGEHEWIIGTGNGIAPSTLFDALQRFDPPPGPGYLWFAGEAASSRQIRTFVRGAWGWDHTRFTVLGYWRVAKEEWVARYRTVSEELEALHSKALADGAPDHVADALFEEALERIGL